MLNMAKKNVRSDTRVTTNPKPAIGLVSAIYTPLEVPSTPLQSIPFIPQPDSDFGSDAVKMATPNTGSNNRRHRGRGSKNHAAAQDNKGANSKLGQPTARAPPGLVNTADVLSRNLLDLQIETGNGEVVATGRTKASQQIQPRQQKEQLYGQNRSQHFGQNTLLQHSMQNEKKYGALNLQTVVNTTSLAFPHAPPPRIMFPNPHNGVNTSNKMPGFDFLSSRTADFLSGAGLAAVTDQENANFGYPVPGAGFGFMGQNPEQPRSIGAPPGFEYLEDKGQKGINDTIVAEIKPLDYQLPDLDPNDPIFPKQFLQMPPWMSPPRPRVSDGNHRIPFTMRDQVPFGPRGDKPLNGVPPKPRITWEDLPHFTREEIHAKSPHIIQLGGADEDYLPGIVFNKATGMTTFEHLLEKEATTTKMMWYDHKYAEGDGLDNISDTEEKFDSVAVRAAAAAPHPRKLRLPSSRLEI